MFAFTGICAVSSLGIDYAQAIYVQKELYSAAETTAQYAVSGVSDGTAVSKAVAFAPTLYVNGSNFSLQSSDVQVGIWNSTTSAFTATSTNPNAIWVSYQRERRPRHRTEINLPRQPEYRYTRFGHRDLCIGGKHRY